MQNFKKDQQIPLVQVTDPNTGQTYYAPQNVVYDEKNNNGPQYLRNVIVDQATTASYFSGSITNAVSASYAATASYLLGSITSASFATSASYALTSSFTTRALSASYAANGGVTQLLAGPNISLSPTNGLGQVTVSATLSGSTIFNTATGSYGSFYDTTTQTNPVANIARSMSLNSTEITNGVSISGSTNPFNTYIKTENAGVYDIQFSAQLDKTDSGTDEIVIWLRKNGIDLTDTATSVSLVGNNAKNVAAWNWFVSSAAGDYYQIIWYSPDTSVRLFAEVAGGGHPGIPSVIVTANRVDQFLSNTGSFSGSFTGVFTGSFSGSVAAPGTTTQVVFNNGGVLGANSGFVYSGSRVGIGTTNPTTALHVSGGLLLTGSTLNSPLILSDGNYIYGGGTSASANAIFGAAAGQTELYSRNNRIGIWGPGGSSNYLYAVSGDFGIGVGAVTPSARLHIRGSGATSATTALRVENTNASASLVVLDNGSVYSYGPKFITSNTAFGAGAHSALDSGSNNTAFGVNAHAFLTNGRNNVGVGLNANRSITIADNNTAVGYHALYTNISASGNTAVGSNALNANTAQNNTAIGGFSLNGNTTGDSNTALGYASLFSNVIGGSNTAVGYATFYNLNTGSGNTAVGINAGRYVSPASLPLSSSNFSVFLGQETRPNSNGETNQIVIGYNANGLGSNTVVLGNSSITTTALRGNVGIGITTPSASLHISGASSATLFEIDSPAVNNILFVSGSGNIGIGTSTPTQKLTIATGSISLDNTYALKIKNPTGSELDMVTLNAGNSLFLGSAQKEIYLRAGNNNILYVTSSAVGIGTTTPSDNLTVIGSTALYAGQTTITGATSGSGTTLLVRNLANTPALTITNVRSSSFNGNVDISGDLNANKVSGMRRFESGFLYDIHPEAANAGIIPFYSNDIAYNTLRGGQFTASFGSGSTYVLNNSQIEALFDGSSNYCIMNPMELSGSMTASIVFPQGYTYSNTIGFSFGSPSWVAKNFTVEILVTGSYVTIDTQTNYSYSNYSKDFSVGPLSATGARITFSNFTSPTNAAGFRIAEIFLLNYNSQLGKAVFVGRDGGAIYKPITIQSGSTAAPAYSSLTDTNTGIYFPAADTLGFVEGGTEAMRINSSGQVGIGTTSQTAQLHISGASSAALLRVESPASSSILFVSGSGRVGIGSSNPQTRLDVLDPTGSLFNFRYSGSLYSQAADTIVGVLGFSNTANNNGFTKAFGYRLSKSTAIANTTDVKLHIDLLREYSFSAATDYSILQSGKVTAFTLDGDGNVGLNATSPSARLHISGASASSLLLLTSPSSNNIMVVSGSGNIGIGNSTPSSRLQVRGSGTTSATTALRVENTNASASLVVLDNGSVYSFGPGFNSQNTSFGFNAGTANTTGTGNVNLGVNAGAGTTVGFNNVYIGTSAGLANTSGSGNVAIGSTNLFTNILGNYNTAIGGQQVLSSAIGTANTAVGFQSFKNLGPGNSNIAFGVSAGALLADGITLLTTSSTSVFIGNETRANANNETNQIVIGNTAIGLGSNTVVLGNDSITRTALKGNVSIGTTGSISSRLQVRGSGTTSATTALLVENANASASLMVRDDGRVGIGTNSPSYTLAVQGDAYFASPVHVGSVLNSLITATGVLYIGNSKLAVSSITGNVIIQNGGTFTDAGYRLDVSGSGRFTNGLTVTGSLIAPSITGSLLGTASYATQALSASWAPGGGASFPYTGSAEITGSLGVTGSFTVNDGTANLISTSDTSLNDSGANTSINWGSRILYDSTSTAFINWDSVGNGGVIDAYNSYFRSEISDNVQDVFSASPFNYEGRVIRGARFNSSVTDYNYVQLASDGKWYTASIDSTSNTAKGMIGISFNVGGRDCVLLEGDLTVTNTTPGTYECPSVASLGHGKPIYLSSSLEATTTIPTTSGQYIRILGHAYHQNGSDSNLWIMHFRPDHTWIQI